MDAMSPAAHDIARILALASDLARHDLPAQALAASCGPARDPTGRGQQWNVEPPGISGVHSLVVLPANGARPGEPARVVVLAFAVGNRPRLSEVEAVFGEGTVVEPLSWESWRVTFDGPSGDHASVLVIAGTDAEPGGGRDPRVEEISLRRDARSTVRFDFVAILAAAFAMVRNAPAPEIARSLGAAREVPGEGWRVEPPKLSGVASVVVCGEGPAGNPAEVVFGFAPGNRPHVRDLEAAFGKGTAAAPAAGEPWRWTFKGPSNSEVKVKLVACSDAASGAGQDTPITELALRREPTR